MAAIGGGAVGSILATWLRLRHEPMEAWRARLLDAADDFATGALQALMKLEFMGDWLWRSHPTGEPGLSKDEREGMRQVDALVDEARARVARVHLLYGTNSQAGKTASALWEALRAAARGLWGDPEFEVIDFSDADRALKVVPDALAEFGAAARRDAWRARMRIHD